MKLKFKLAQINLLVGDLPFNFQKIKDVVEQAKKEKTDIVIFPELAITGYPPEDLLYKKRFINENMKVLNRIAVLCTNLICIIGFVNKKKERIYNSAAVIYNKKIVYIYDKINLPNYSVFDEKRYFHFGEKIPVLDLGGVRFGLGICEDLWVKESPFYTQAEIGQTQFIININASPYYINKHRDRLDFLKKLSKKTGNHLFYLNLIGGQDEIVFDGNSLVVDDKGKLIAAGKQFDEEIIDLSLDIEDNKIIPVESNDFIDYVEIKNFKPQRSTGKKQKRKKIDFLSGEEEIYRALILGTGDYLLKNGFEKAVIGLSGGIDSALTACVAVDALGSGNVDAIFMPSRFSSDESYQDAQKLAKNLKVKFHVLPIEVIFNIYLQKLNPVFKGLPFDLTEENIQARIRGNLLMAYSNKFGNMVLTTGNKSEMSTGYSTLYGDLAGGYAVIKDVYKTMVYRICKALNKKAGYELIPKNIIHKAPTAELRANQKDSDSLPEYDILDRILYYYIEEHMTYDDINKLKKFESRTIKKVINLINRSEYKRRQAPPGVKITKLSFGKDRRMPITNGYVLK